MVLDAGALLALERDDRVVWRKLRGTAGAGLPSFVPAAALAQVWRGGPRQALLVRALRLCVLASFDEMAEAVGELCATSGTADVVDASVALTAVRHGATAVCTSDPDHLGHLLHALGADDVRLLPC